VKPIIVDMKDISDSTEVYDSKPSPVLTGFIYLILAMVVIAFIWMYFCKMDIVVKGTGTIEAAEDVATITNQVSGEILERRISDGQSVQKGEVLYVVSHEEQSLQLSSLQKQLADLEEKEVMLKAYEAWLTEEEAFPAELTDNLYYVEIASRKLLLELGQENTRQQLSGELSAYETKLDANEDMITYYKEAIEKSKQLITAIKNKENSFSSEENYYWNMVENYLMKFQQTSGQYDEKIEELQEQSESAQKEIEALEAKKLALQEQERSLLLAVSTVSGGDAVPSDNTLLTVQQEIQQVETGLAGQRNSKESADKSIRQYTTQRNNALNAYEKETIAAIEGNILTYEQNVTAYEGTRQEYANAKNTLTEQGTEIQLENLLVQEQRTVVSELEACRQSKVQVSNQIESLEQVVENATVKASMDGKVNLATDLVVGDYLGAGTQVLSIIPDTEEGAFLVKSYVENKDIAKIQEGMQVTYEIGAYPSREYGTMRGEVSFVSADLKVNNNGSAYYVVETTVDAGELCNQNGEKAALKVGMLCETKIVVEEKRVLEVLLEKLFHRK